VIRKPSKRDASAEAMQRQQKTPRKMKNEAGVEPLSAQNSDFPPLSQPETPDNKANCSGSDENQPCEAATHADLKFNQRKRERAKSVAPPPKRIGLRIIAGFLAFIPLTLLIIAGNLNPAEKGLGTHQQLGLPPCSLRVLAGIRCPACGMTTSWSYFARGNWLASMNTNAGGFLLALLCVAMIVLAAQVVRCGLLPSPRVQTWLTIAGAGVLVVTLVDWIIRLQS
jgi:hypothetical protein